MPRVRTVRYKSEVLEFSYVVNVDKEGNFSTTLPEEAVTKMMQVSIHFHSNRQYREGYFSAPSLNELIKEVTDTAKQYSEKELVEEKLILR